MALGDGPHRGMVGGSAVSLNPDATEWPRSSVTWTMGVGCSVTQFRHWRANGGGGSRVENLKRGHRWPF
jgi:hypothetical protein